ncbi:signal peptidase I [Synechocystis sp. PCC 7509]|uniref:signal peptidase I n=1 Tax=Synechocystis sp. PCC 7509 TaxID=927677 RepID=UPI0002ABE4C2|nr:signal peptidase I [Synechocystis sp. PCC 7509]
MVNSNNIVSPSSNNKEPWLAVNLSAFLAGIGQIYTGNIVKGWLFIISQLLLYVFGFGLIFSSKGDTVIGILLIVFGFAFGIFNLFDAYRSAVNRNNTDFEILRKDNKDPWKAVFFSRIIPGTGHIYLEKTFLGIFIITVWISSFFWQPGSKTIILAIFITVINLVVFVAIVYHVYISSPIKRELSKKAIFIISTLSIIIPLFIISPIFIAVRAYVAESRYIASNAMLPTLKLNDRLIINKWDYHFQSPQRKDIVVFSVTDTIKAQNPVIKSNEAFIQRLVGLPGETVEVKEGKVFINNQPLQEDYISEPAEYQFNSTTVPPNSYFVLGDSRNNSFDSHIWGFLPKANIIGKAVKIFFPFERRRIL